MTGLVFVIFEILLSYFRRAAAERQAVNTKVQGSAADLVKLAMINIDQEINKIWPNRRPLKSNK